MMYFTQDIVNFIYIHTKQLYSIRAEIPRWTQKKQQEEGKQSAEKARRVETKLVEGGGRGEEGGGRERGWEAAEREKPRYNVAHRPRSMSLETDGIDFLALFFRFILFFPFFFSSFFFA